MVALAKDFVAEPVGGFNFEQMMLTRTDNLGVIQSTNDVFNETFQFERSQVKDAPHKIVRHPDMPKSLFWLMWDILKAGIPFAGYVKNRSSSGTSSWVFLIIMPVTDGYLSVQMAPNSDLLQPAKKFYEELLDTERSGEVSPQQGGQNIKAFVQDLGYRNYVDFMTDAASREYKVRMDLLKRSVDPGFADFESINGFCKKLSDDVAQVIKHVASIKNVPANLKVLGARLDGGGASIKVLAQDYETTTATLLQDIAKLSADLNILLGAAQSGRFGTCANLIYGEAISQFARAPGENASSNASHELPQLHVAMQDFIAAAQAKNLKISEEFRNYATLTNRLRKYLTGLSMNRVMCRIESAVLKDDTTSIEAIVTQLSRFQDDIRSALDRTLQNCHAVSSLTHALAQRQEKSAAA